MFERAKRFIDLHRSLLKRHMLAFVIFAIFISLFSHFFHIAMFDLNGTFLFKMILYCFNLFAILLFLQYTLFCQKFGYPFYNLLRNMAFFSSPLFILFGLDLHFFEAGFDRITDILLDYQPRIREEMVGLSDTSLFTEKSHYQDYVYKPFRYVYFYTLMMGIQVLYSSILVWAWWCFDAKERVNESFENMSFGSLLWELTLLAYFFVLSVIPLIIFVSQLDMRIALIVLTIAGFVFLIIYCCIPKQKTAKLSR